MKVLIVEDDTENRDMMILLLSTEGNDVIAAGDGCEGLEMAQAHLPDIIITDIYMPNLDGIDMILQLRAHAGLESVPIIVLSACNKKDKERASRAGASVVLSKPVRMAELTQLMESLSGRPGIRPPLAE